MYVLFLQLRKPRYQKRQKSTKSIKKRDGSQDKMLYTVIFSPRVKSVLELHTNYSIICKPRNFTTVSSPVVFF